MFKTVTAVAMFALMTSAASADSHAAKQPGSHFIENWDLDGDGRVTVEEAKERRESVFASFDSDEDGFLVAEEYALFDEARANDASQHGEGMGKGGRRAQEGMTLAFNDTDQDGKVSKAEFLDRAQAWLALIDRDGDAVVTSADFGPRS